MNKTLGYVFYGIGVILILSIVGRIGKFIGDIINVGRMFSSDIDGIQRGQIIGALVVWILIIVAIYYLFRYGNKYTKK